MAPAKITFLYPEFGKHYKANVFVMFHPLFKHFYYKTTANITFLYPELGKHYKTMVFVLFHLLVKHFYYKTNVLFL